LWDVIGMLWVREGKKIVLPYGRQWEDQKSRVILPR
jgi:hypothetical protein